MTGDAPAQRNDSPTDPETTLREAQRLAKSITGANWKAKKAALLGLLGATEVQATAL